MQESSPMEYAYDLCKARKFTIFLGIVCIQSKIVDFVFSANLQLSVGYQVI